MREVAGLGPKAATLRSCSGSERRFRREPQPGIPGELLAAFDEAAGQDEQLDPAWKRHLDAGARRPALHADALPCVLEQCGPFDARKAARGQEREAGSVDAQLRPIVWVELPEFDEDRATRL